MDLGDRQREMHRALAAILVALSAYGLLAVAQPSLADQPSVLVLVHGVASSGDRNSPDYAYAPFRQWAAENLGQAQLIDFDWAHGSPDLLAHASFRVGHRADQIEGQSDAAWLAVAKLKHLVAELRHTVGAAPRIHLVAHSQGTVIALAALQEGLPVTSATFMGSPLGENPIARGADGCDLATAAQFVSERFVNLCSPDDRVVELLKPNVNLATPGGCIGARGLPSEIRGFGRASQSPDGRVRTWQEERASGMATRVESISVDGVEHSGRRGWWGAYWLSNGSENIWPEGQHAAQLVGAWKSSVPLLIEEEIIAFAGGTEFVATCGRGFGSGNAIDRAEWTFTLTRAMETGFHFDDKRSLEIELEVLEGACTREVLHATWYEWEPECGLPPRECTPSEGVVQESFASPNELADATLLLRLEGTTPFCRIRCRVKASRK